MDRDLLRFEAELDQVRAEVRTTFGKLATDDRIALFRACTAGHLADLDDGMTLLVGRLAALAMTDLRQPTNDHSDLVGKGEWTHEAVPPGCECPGCKEWCPDLLVWVEDDRVECQTCGAIYDPRDGKVHAYRNSDGRTEDANDA